MEIENNIIILLDSLGLVQGVLMGFMLILLHYRKTNAIIYLGLFIILFSLEPLNNILYELEISKKKPELLLIPVSFHFLAYPFFYIYIQKISILEKENIKYWTLIPGILEVVIGTIIFFLPVSTKLHIHETNAKILYFIFGMSYTFYILYLILKWIARHRKELENQYSSLQYRKLKWSQYFIYASVIFHFMLLFSHVTENSLIYLLYSIVNVILIYWISYQGFAQQNISPLYNQLVLHHENEKNTTIQIADNKVKGENNTTVDKQKPDDDEILKEALDTIQEYILNSKCFTKEDLTIVDVSEAVNIHPRRISHTINKLLNTNFNNYINSYRIEYAKELFTSKAANNLSIEGIGIEAGFHSKTTFYSAFKKIEGTTPAKYRNT